jgi:DNA-binding LacI/PurR family transcriptional regulator
MPAMASPAERATIRDVAARAGVSTATVSRVLAGLGHPRAETAAAVQAAVAALRYRPSGVARSLRMQQTRTLGLIVTDIQNPFFPELVQAADQAARGLGYSILLGSAAYDEGRARHYLDLMVDRRVDGMIVASSQIAASSSDWLLASPVPVVVLNTEPGGLPVPLITSDNRGGARLAAEHLLGLGHRRLAYVRGRASFSADVPRVEGFRAACAAAGLRPDDWLELRGDGGVEGGERAARELIARDDGTTAVACFNDTTAIGVLRALRTAGIRVPADISVIGCDDITAASWVTPALTTVAQQKAEMGRLAVERLAAMLAGGAGGQGDGAAAPDGTPPEPVRLPMILKVRESTGAVRA